MCRCSENLDWLVPLVADVDFEQSLNKVSDLVIHLYETCGQGDGGTTKLQDALSGNLIREILEGESGSGPNCESQSVLRHLMRYSGNHLPRFLLFLPSASPLEAEQHLYTLVFRSIASKTLSVDYMALGITRSPPISLNACQKSLIRSEVLKIQSYPLGYEGPRFLVSSTRLRESTERLESLIHAFNQPPPDCTSLSLQSAVADWWHIVFGEAEQLPIRADDERLPIFARMGDGPSGFSRTRMPKSSDYLGWAAIGLEGS